MYSEASVPGVMKMNITGLWKWILFQEEKSIGTPLSKFRKTLFSFFEEEQFKKASHALSQFTLSPRYRLILSDILADWKVNHKSNTAFDEVCNMSNNYYIIHY